MAKFKTIQRLGATESPYYEATGFGDPIDQKFVFKSRKKKI
ncbi:hypothetical protein [Pedobacter segetis]|nr:hypothetical protein [Pedobacter segetis]